jgi:polyhydroxyalkanoate synthase
MSTDLLHRNIISPRVGPRPLAIHLGLAGTAWLAGGLEQGCPTHQSCLAARRKFEDLSRGIEAYWTHPYRREATDYPVLWRDGTTRLIDYTPDAAPPPERVALLVPSLVNRAYILDLAPGRSLTHYLAARGIRPLVVDWGEPGDSEQALDLTGYVTQRLTPALEVATAIAGRPVDILGYCMGGLLALALALARGEHCASFVALATPWDFHAEQTGWGAVLKALRPVIDAIVQRDGVLPVDVLQACFAVTQPSSAIDKFRAFASLDPVGPDALAFVQVEDWLNDGVPLAGRVAAECLFGWYGENAPARGTWTINGRAMDPNGLDLPALAFIPTRDMVVPPGSARALADAIPGATSIAPSAGHVGMVVGRAAETECWRPLADWLFASAK